MTTHPAIHVDGLGKRFESEDETVQAVEDVSFTVESGSIVGLLGPNGAGKTTTIKSMLGLVVPDDGTIEISGIDARANPNQAYERVGAMLEGARNIYWRLTVRENLVFFAGLGGDDPATLREEHDRLLSLLDLEDKAETPVRELSRGMKQKAALASTLARDVDVVVLDEPTLGLDVEASNDLQSELRRLAREQDVTIILSSHDMTVIEHLCDRVILIQDGSILVDQSVTALLDVFQRQQYRVTVTPPSSPDPADTCSSEKTLTEELTTNFEATIVDDDEQLQIDVTVSDTEELYSLLAWLKSEACSLVDLDSRERDLEEIFLRLVEDDLDRSAPATTALGVTGGDE